jgi:hypothetical protein
MLLNIYRFWLKSEKTRQAIYLQRNIEVRSCNDSCLGKAISITYSERVSVALFIQREKRLCHVML